MVVTAARLSRARWFMMRSVFDEALISGANAGARLACRIIGSANAKP